MCIYVVLSLQVYPFLCYGMLSCLRRVRVGPYYGSAGKRSADKTPADHEHDYEEFRSFTVTNEVPFMKRPFSNNGVKTTIVVLYAPPTTVSCSALSLRSSHARQCLVLSDLRTFSLRLSLFSLSISISPGDGRSWESVVFHSSVTAPEINLNSNPLPISMKVGALNVSRDRTSVCERCTHATLKNKRRRNKN